MRIVFDATLLASAWLGSLVIAQVSDMNPNLWALIANGGTVLVLVWYMIYDVRVRQPNMLAAFQAEQTASRVAFAAEQTATRLAFAQQLATSNERHDVEVSEYRKMFFELMKSMRDAVHDVRDTAQTFIQTKAVQDLTQSGAIPIQRKE